MGGIVPVIGLFALWIAISCAVAEPAAAFFEIGKRTPTIVVGAQATASEKFAAEELATYLGKITGKKFRIVDDSKAVKGKVICVGKSKLTESIDISGLGIERYIMDVTPDKLSIVGGRQPMFLGQYVRDRGTLYGVYDLLDELGVKWYRPEEWGEFVPKISKIRIPVERRVSRQPDYILRSTSGHPRFRETSPEMASRNELWAARNHLNRDAGGDPTYGGAEFYSFSHIYAYRVPPDKYFKDHPDYFALIDGKRDPGDLCLSNPELQNLFAENVIEWARANPQYSSISVEPNDARGGTCQCPQCKAMADPADPKNLSNQVCAFSNIIAKKLAPAVPGVKVHWLAYSGHTQPPTVVKQLEPNTIIQLCPINEWGDFTKKLLGPEAGWNASFANILAGWAKVEPSAIMTYEYWSGYGWMGPIPVTRVMVDRLRNYRQFNVKGIYNETCPSWGPQGLELYMCAKLLWNPDIDVDRELNLYYKNFYGPAEKPMKAYHEAMMNALEKHPRPVFSGGRGMHLVFTPALVKELGGYIEQAQSLVKGKPLYEKRLEGVASGYECARRVCEVLKLKKTEGTLIKDKDGRSYLSTPKADKAYEDLKKWMLSFNKGDVVFDIATKPPYDSFVYMDDDVLKNGAFSYLPEEGVLQDFEVK